MPDGAVLWDKEARAACGVSMAGGGSLAIEKTNCFGEDKTKDRADRTSDTRKAALRCAAKTSSVAASVASCAACDG